MPPKKICFSCPTTLLRRPIADLAKKLRRDHICILLPRDYIKGLNTIHLNKVKSVKVNSYPTINPPKLSIEWPIPIRPFFLLRYYRLLKNYDIIHMWVPFYISNTSLIILKRLFFPFKKIYLTMDTFPGLSFKMGKTLNFFFQFYYNSIGKLIFPSINKLILYNQISKSYALKIGVPEKKIEVLPTGVDIQVKIATKNIREEFNINADEKIILFVGILNPRKGIDTIIEIAKQFKNKKVKFIIVGDGSKTKHYKKITYKNKIDCVIFTGFRRDVYNFYTTADIFLFPSKGEGLPGVLMECMVYGVPIVASNVTGNLDMIENEVNGFLCEEDDINDYADKINRLLTNEILREKFIRNSKKVVKEKYNWANNIKSYLKIYE